MNPVPLIARTVCLALVSSLPAGAAVDVSPDVARRLDETGAPVKVWVFLADKGFADAGAETAALDALAVSLPERVARRRALRRTRDGLVDVADLPVAAPYVEAIASFGLDVQVESRWLNAVSVTVDRERLAALAELPFVTRIRLVGRSLGVPLSPTRAGGGYAGTIYGVAEDQLALIGVTTLHGLGHTGAGVVIGVLDTGFVTTHDAFNQPGFALDVLASYDFVDDDPVVGIEAGDDPTQHQHGTIILGTMAAYLPSTIVGAAYDASYVLCKTEDVTSETQAEEDFYVAGLEFAESSGADVVTSSLRYVDWYTQDDMDGETAVTSIAVNIATGNGVHCCTSVGNDGHDTDPATSTLGAPADAFDVLSVGAVAVTGEPASFTSSGPTADGRVKPEIMAMGEAAYSIWPDDDVSLVTASGTSMSAPQLAGAVACLAGARPEWSVATMRDRLLRTADFFGEPAPDPLFVWGWGIANADLALLVEGTWTDLGGGVAGVSGVPLLGGGGPLVGDEDTTLTVSNALPFGSVFVVLGQSPLNAPFKGGTLVPSVDILLSGFSTDGSGELVVTAPWVPYLPSALDFWCQAWIPDAAGPVGFAGSNGVRGTTP